ncbi:uncharacterized protein LOC132755963 [Ruditapes philippinarum]|uniref:uncharacterized protein LOC132755963 n=1 Tax=Ruditapes philippinarum TaxID=129788 RepID=UPI00295BB75C|nr:uncharacterized protein LOC132755963 [Ruditapes philippinarum]
MTHSFTGWERRSLVGGNSTGLDLSRFAYTPSRLNGRVNEGIATSSDRSGLYGEQALNNVACDRPDWHSDIQQQNINVRPRNDWQELDMYAKHRQTFNPDDGILNDEASLPDIEASGVEYADCNLDMDTADNWETVDECNDGFGHETDYGYTYVTNDDRPDLPLEWDDRMNEQWQQTNRNLKDSKCNLGRTKGRQANSLKAQSFVPGRHETLPYNYGTRKPTVIKQAAYGVSPVDNVYSASYKSKNGTPSKAALRESTAQGCKDDSYYSDNTRKYLEPNKVNSDNKKTICGKQPFFNRDRFPQNASSSVSDDRCNDYYQCLTNREKSHSNSFRNESANASLQGPSNAHNVNRVSPSDKDENIYPDEYIDLYKEGTEGHQSRWTNYFSSQSSSASDNLNWKYPTRNCDNKVVMETCDLSNTQNTQQISRRQPVIAVNGATRLSTNISDDNSLDNDKDYKYGEVLAWVSSSERAQKDKLQSKSSTTRASTLTSKPEQDSFMGIFDGIL